ncbi:MAG: type II secretion system GspH family protein [Candidatus Calescibacterium sp.]|nr:type II secretion system GspH family protein [Candidatus Calescibacterium sp.]
MKLVKCCRNVPTSKVFRSFTLIELAIVLGIISLFLGLVFPSLPFVSQEKAKSDARLFASVFSDILRESLNNKKPVKISILKKEREIKVFRCLPTEYQDEEWKEREKEIEKLKTELGFTIPFKFEEIGPAVCEWKEVGKKKVSSEITSVFVEGEETFGNEIEILFQGINIPFVEVELDKKIWVILNPYIFRVFLDTKPAHKT